MLAERPSTLADPPCAETFPDNGAPKWDESKRVLTFFVAKGRIVRLRYASFVDKRFVDTLGLADWTDTAGDAQFVRNMAQLGCGWMTTPYRSLVLVHATQQPVCAPAFLGLSVQRDLGDQHATLSSRLRMHGRSTGKFEIEAAWQEWVDDVDKPGPELVDSHGQLGEIQLPENYVNLFSLGPTVDAQQPAGTGQKRARGDRHEFGDTKFRLIHYTMRATTRFREYLPAALYSQRDQVTRVGPIADGPAMKVGAANDPGAPVLAVGSGTAPNTVVPATAPPDDPRVVYTVPTFRWAETPGAGSLDTTRLGNGLRVWLERPWFSSGNGELLGRGDPGRERGRSPTYPPSLVPLVTQWGLDPLWDTTLPKFRSRVEDFPARVTAEAVSLRESDVDDGAGRRAPRAVGCGSRRLWYCDIELDPGATLHAVRAARVRPLSAERARRGEDLEGRPRRLRPGAAAAAVDVQANRRAADLHAPRHGAGPRPDAVPARFARTRTSRSSRCPARRAKPGATRSSSCCRRATPRSTATSPGPTFRCWPRACWRLPAR